jgi:hypothetical protein
VSTWGGFLIWSTGWILKNNDDPDKAGYSEKTPKPSNLNVSIPTIKGRCHED